MMQNSFQTFFYSWNVFSLLKQKVKKKNTFFARLIFICYKYSSRLAAIYTYTYNC